MHFWRSHDGHGRYHGTRAEETPKAQAARIQKEEKEVGKIDEAFC